LGPDANFNLSINAQPVVLVAPLDWGLGHATRCIPLIHQFLSADCEVIIAAQGQQRQLLAQEFPSLSFVDLPAYGLKYGKSRWYTLVKIVLQSPKILIIINREKKWLKKLIRDKHLDIVVSDNRFGLHHPSVTSVFITHQLRVKSSFGNRADAILQRINYRFIHRFDYCWVPDAEGDNNLAGALSHPPVLPHIPTRYTGALSRIKKENLPANGKLLVLLSGPEPQRTVFEQKLVEQLNALHAPAIIVRGLAGTPAPAAGSLLEIQEHLPAAAMQDAINKASIIISRSGYSTIMDLLPLGKKCIFIPTPGQPEQEYLAAYLAAKGWCCTATQESFSLPQLLEQAEQLRLPDLSGLNDPGQLQQLVTGLLAKSSAMPLDNQKTKTP
jgi:UDP-N-acetylglucosamine transferase subunit ALG13